MDFFQRIPIMTCFSRMAAIISHIFLLICVRQIHKRAYCHIMCVNAM